VQPQIIFTQQKRDVWRTEKERKKRACVRTTLQITYFRKQITFLFFYYAAALKEEEKEEEEKSN